MSHRFLNVSGLRTWSQRILRSEDLLLSGGFKVYLIKSKLKLSIKLWLRFLGTLHSIGILGSPKAKIANKFQVLQKTAKYTASIYMFNLCKILYNSPTFTEWGMKLIQPLRLLLLTPLVLTRLSIEEQAAWFLFSTIAFFGLIVNSRIQATFSNMVAIAYGGAKDLSPIKEIKKAEPSDGEAINPNWSGVIKVYNSSSKILFLAVTFVFIVNSLVGYLTLGNISANLPSASANVIWISFAVMRLGDYTGSVSAAPIIVLRGLNYVSLINRVGLFFQIVSLLAGVAALIFGGNLIVLVVAMQGVLAIQAIYNFFLLKGVNDGMFWDNWKLRIDANVLKWAREPLWRGTVFELSKLGSFHVSTLILTYYVSSAMMASYLLTLMMIRAVQNISIAPFSSKLPRFSRLMSTGEYEVLSREFIRSISLSTAIYIMGASCVFLIGDYVLNCMGSLTQLIDKKLILVLSLLILYRIVNNYASMICAAGNNIIMYKSELLCGLVSCVLSLLFIPYYGIMGLVFSLLLPTVIIINVRPLRAIKKQLGLKYT